MSAVKAEPSAVVQAADLYLEKEKDLYIQTVKGRRFYMSHPEFDIEEIAHAISMQCRFTGHTREFYSVAEHCVIASHMIQQHPEIFELPATPYEALMHDAHEGYVSDIASPWKALIPDYRKMEEGLELKLRRHYGLSDKISRGAKLADWAMLFVEAQVLLVPGVSDDWLTPSEDFREKVLAPVLAGDKFHPQCWTPKQAKSMFMARYYALRNGS